MLNWGCISVYQALVTRRKNIYKDKTNKTTRYGKNNNNTSPIAGFY